MSSNKKDSQALIRFVPLALNASQNWSSSIPKKTPLDDLRTTLESVELKLESKLDRLLADNESLRAQHAAATAENERLRASNAELAASVRALGASLADARTDTSARMLYGLRAAEHAAREQRVLLRELSERVERVEYEGGIGMPGLGMGMGTGGGGLVGWGPREAIEGSKVI